MTSDTPQVWLVYQSNCSRLKLNRDRRALLAEQLPPTLYRSKVSVVVNVITVDCLWS